VVIRFNPNLVFLGVTYYNDFSGFDYFWVSEGKRYSVPMYAIKVYEGFEVQIQLFLASQSDGISIKINC